MSDISMDFNSEPPITVVPLQIIDFNSNDSYDAIMGGMNSNPTWEEYLDDYENEFHPHIELIKKAIIDNGWVGMTGEQKQNENISFKFSDGNHWGYSWRAWGDLMQAIVGKREGYMKYYM